ncbi:MAG: chemotaxis protein CheE [Caulobacter sp.]|nr:chemotaxis protein CheE [Caulobacter sp.]
MTVVTWFRKRPRLASLIDSSGGMTVIKALRSAEANTAPLREEALAAVDGILTDLEALTAVRPDEPAADLARVYVLSASLLDVAGPFGLEDMCKAAYSLCDLVDRQTRAGRCDMPPVQVHVASLRVLAQAGQSAEARAQVLSGLELLLAREQRVGG